MEKIININGVSVNYDISGEGKVIVLLHGFLESLSIWDHFSTELSKKYKIIAIDLPGHGKTGIFNDEHSMSFMAFIVHELLKQEHIEKCFMVGHSMGGSVSLAFAEKYVHHLTGICLFHSNADEDTPERKKYRDKTIKLVEENRIGFISSFIDNLFYKENIEKHSNVIKKLKDISLNTSKEGIIAAIKGMKNRKSHLTLLENLDIPVYFIIGKQDSRINFDEIIKQTLLPKISEILILDKVGHMGYIEAEYLTLNAIDNFARLSYIISKFQQ